MWIQRWVDVGWVEVSLMREWRVNGGLIVNERLIGGWLVLSG